VRSLQTREGQRRGDWSFSQALKLRWVMSKRQGTDGISLHGLVGWLMVRIRAQDKSRAPPSHSFIGLTCQRGSGAAAVWVRQVSQVQAALGPTSLAISPRSSREALNRWLFVVVRSRGHAAHRGRSGRGRSAPAPPGIRIVGLVLGQDRPHHPRVLVGDGDQGFVVAHACVQLHDPVLQSG